MSVEVAGIINMWSKVMGIDKTIQSLLRSARAHNCPVGGAVPQAPSPGQPSHLVEKVPRIFFGQHKVIDVSFVATIGMEDTHTPRALVHFGGELKHESHASVLFGEGFAQADATSHAPS